MRDTIRQIITFLGIIGGIVLNSVPAFGGSLIPTDSAVNTFADRTATYLLPADGTFFIWSVIFLWTAVFAVHQALPVQRENALYRQIGYGAALNGIAGGLWTLAFVNQQYVLAWLLILVLFGSLLTVTLRIGFGSYAPRGRDYWLAYVPFNINFAWISVATIINTAQVLRYVWDWGGEPLSPQLWAALLVLMAVALGLWQLRQLNNIPFGMVVAWAISGIAVEQAATPLVLVPAVAGVLMLIAALIVRLAQKRVNIFQIRTTKVS